MTMTPLAIGTSQHIKTAHTASYADPLTVQSGEPVTITDRFSEWQGWLWCLNRSGKGGWLPEELIDQQGTEGTVLQVFSTKELSVQVDELVTLQQFRNDWYWVTNRDQQSGWIPAECFS